MPERAEKQVKPQQAKKPLAVHEAEKAPVFDVQANDQPANPVVDLQASIGNQGVQHVLAQQRLKHLHPNALVHSQGIIGNQAMRQMIENTDLLTRLERARDHAPLEHRSMIMNVEGILWKVTTGPVHESDMRILRQIANSLDLISELDRLTGNANPRHSM